MIHLYYNKIPRWAKSFLSLLPFALLSFLAACSHIADDQQLIYVPAPQATRCVLLEDFTGQRCINCPTANEEIQRLQVAFGHDAIIPVAIHSGPLGMRSTSRYVGLSTDEGDAYFDHWQFDHQPIGLVDRGGVSEYTEWNNRIREELQKPSPLHIQLTMTLHERQLTLHASLTALQGTVQGKLQLWLTEDNITALQLMPDGTRKEDYLHQHVLRQAVNGTWGEDVTIPEGQTVTTQDYVLTIPADWKPADLALVGFVYNASGVVQVARNNSYQ